MRSLRKDVFIFKQDVHKHFVYTIFIIVVTSFAISTVWFIHANKTNSATQTNEDVYVERGSPYDNRTIDNQSADVIFHGPRDKKQIALTFDAEMTDGMRANVFSGVAKTSYNKQVI